MFAAEAVHLRIAPNRIHDPIEDITEEDATVASAHAVSSGRHVSLHFAATEAELHAHDGVHERGEQKSELKSTLMGKLTSS